MENRFAKRFKKPLYRLEAFANLSFLDLKLVLVSDRKPFRSSVHLEMRGQFRLKRRLFYRIQHLGFDMVLFRLKNAEIDDRTRDHASRNHYSPPIGMVSESFSGKNEFFHEDVFECGVFHRRQLYGFS